MVKFCPHKKINKGKVQCIGLILNGEQGLLKVNGYSGGEQLGNAVVAADGQAVSILLQHIMGSLLEHPTYEHRRQRNTNKFVFLITLLF